MRGKNLLNAVLAGGFDIGSLHVSPPVVLAPMAGISSWPMRLLCRKMGAPLAFTEMISAPAVARGKLNSDTINSLKTHPDERPLGFQIFGAKPLEMAAAARELSALEADIIDINMGCPVKKVVKSGAGAALMKDLDRARDLIAQVRKACQVPLTVKMRTGWDDASKNAALLARVCEGEGVDAVIVHGRTRARGFSGEPDFDAIAEVVRAVSIPVIGNGGVMSARDAVAMMDRTGCAGVMVARGARGNPWIFQAMIHGDHAPQANPKIDELKAAVLQHLEWATDYVSPRQASLEMRKHLCWYSRGIENAVEFRRQLHGMDSPEKIRDLVDRYFHNES